MKGVCKKVLAFCNKVTRSDATSTQYQTWKKNEVNMCVIILIRVGL